jgi:hypothetical protein
LDRTSGERQEGKGEEGREGGRKEKKARMNE